MSVAKSQQEFFSLVSRKTSGQMERLPLIQNNQSSGPKNDDTLCLPGEIGRAGRHTGGCSPLCVWAVLPDGLYCRVCNLLGDEELWLGSSHDKNLRVSHPPSLAFLCMPCLFPPPSLHPSLLVSPLPWRAAFAAVVPASSEGRIPDTLLG